MPLFLHSYYLLRHSDTLLVHFLSQETHSLPISISVLKFSLKELTQRDPKRQVTEKPHV